MTIQDFQNLFPEPFQGFTDNGIKKVLQNLEELKIDQTYSCETVVPKNTVDLPVKCEGFAEATHACPYDKDIFHGKVRYKLIDSCTNKNNLPSCVHRIITDNGETLDSVSSKNIKKLKTSSDSLKAEALKTRAIFQSFKDIHVMLNDKGRTPKHLESPTPEELFPDDANTYSYNALQYLCHSSYGKFSGKSTFSANLNKKKLHLVLSYLGLDCKEATGFKQAFCEPPTWTQSWMSLYSDKLEIDCKTDNYLSKCSFLLTKTTGDKIEFSSKAYLLKSAFQVTTKEHSSFMLEKIKELAESYNTMQCEIIKDENTLSCPKRIEEIQVEVQGTKECLDTSHGTKPLEPIVEAYAWAPIIQGIACSSLAALGFSLSYHLAKELKKEEKEDRTWPKVASCISLFVASSLTGIYGLSRFI